MAFLYASSACQKIIYMLHWINWTSANYLVIATFWINHWLLIILGQKAFQVHRQDILDLN